MIVDSKSRRLCNTEGVGACLHTATATDFLTHTAVGERISGVVQMFKLSSFQKSKLQAFKLFFQDWRLACWVTCIRSDYFGLCEVTFYYIIMCSPDWLKLFNCLSIPPSAIQEQPRNGRNCNEHSCQNPWPKVSIFHRAYDMFSKNYSNQPNEILYQIDKFTGVSARDIESECFHATMTTHMSSILARVWITSTTQS